VSGSTVTTGRSRSVRFLNDLEPFREKNPSTEVLARYIFEELTARLPGGVELTEVTAWETPGCAATYRP